MIISFPKELLQIAFQLPAAGRQIMLAIITPYRVVIKATAMELVICSGDPYWQVPVLAQ